MSGTLQRANATPLVRIGSATKPRPTIANPKGTLRMAKKTGSDVYIYSWMDSALVYFIDNMYGPGHSAVIHRKNSQG